MLVFKERRRKNQEVSLLSARQLSQWLRGSEVRLFYLNCCVAAASGHHAHLRSNDYLAVMDALVQAGIPYVFGYRWYVTDHGSRLCAEQFYTSLLDSEYGLYVPEYAVWEARRKLYGENAFDETWASPVLIAQQSLAVN